MHLIPLRDLGDLPRPALASAADVAKMRESPLQPLAPKYLEAPVDRHDAHPMEWLAPQKYRVLRLVRQARATVIHLRDPGARVRRRPPHGVGQGLARPGLLKPPPVPVLHLLDSRFLPPAAGVRLVILDGILTADHPDGSDRLTNPCGQSERRAGQSISRTDQTRDLDKHYLVDCLRPPLPQARQYGVFRRWPRQCHNEERTRGQPIAAPISDALLPVQPHEVANNKSSDVSHARDAGSDRPAFLDRPVEPFPVTAALGPLPVKSKVERAADRVRSAEDMNRSPRATARDNKPRATQYTAPRLYQSYTTGWLWVGECFNPQLEHLDATPVTTGYYIPSAHND